MSSSLVQTVFVRGSLVCRSACRQDHEVARCANERDSHWWQLYREGCHPVLLLSKPNFKQHNMISYNIDTGVPITSETIFHELLCRLSF
jgi:hypothetical protein